MFESKGEKLEKARREALSDIRGSRLDFEEMLQRGQRAGDSPDSTFVTGVLSRLAEIEQRVSQEADTDELDRLSEQAKRQAYLRAYACPRVEILDEGGLSIDLMDEWNVPKSITAKLRESLGQKLKEADKDLESARSALRAIFEEYDSWESYTDEYETTMKGYTHWLFGATVVLLLVAALALHFPLRLFPVTLLVGLLSAGAAGSCVSVIAKLPVLDVTLSGDLDAYGRRILSRIGAGIIASLIGCALLGWGLLPLSIQNQSFADVLNACTASPVASCTGLKTLILLAVPVLLGFSERALTSFDQRFFGNSRSARNRS